VTHCRTRRVFALLCLTLVLLVTAGALPVGAAGSLQTAAPAANLTADNPTVDDPADCIDPLKAGHIAATLASLVPIPFFATVADVAAFGFNLALKSCPPEMTPPPDIVITQPNQGCAHVMNLVVPINVEELVALEREIMQELINLPELNLTPTQVAEMQRLQQLEYGRFENKAYFSYSNIFGISLPLRVSPFAVPQLGDFGVPQVYHYNSSVLVEMTYPGTRVSLYAVSVPVGNHSVRWQGDTLIGFFDKYPVTVLASAAYRYYKAAQAQAQKRLAISAADEAFQASLRQVLKEGNKFFVKQVAKEIAQNVALKGLTAAGTIAYASSTYNAPDDATGVSTTVFQGLRVVDRNAPVINGVQPVTLEAFDPGGLQASRKLNELTAALSVTDDCDPDPSLTPITPAFWPLLVDTNGNPLPSAEIRWQAKDNGATPTGGVNTAEVIQQITIADTLPPLLVAPPPVMMYADNGESVEVPLGTPQVFDVADLRPTVNYAAPGSSPGAKWPSFGRGVHYVTWTATDKSRNTSEPKQQLVNIKAPGTNNPPTATPLTGDKTVQAIADEPVRITVSGQDPNVDGQGLRDPIWFRIDDQPDNGFFIAPLLPYFIDDYRITARYSPQIAAAEGEEFALQVAQSTSAMRDYIISLCEEDINRRDLPKDFVSFYGGGQKYMAVDDDGYTYIYDQAYRRCTPGGSTIAPQTGARISVWDANGVYVGEQERADSSGGRPLRDIKFNVGRGTIVTTESDGSTTGNSLVNISLLQPGNAAEPIVDVRSYGLWNKVNGIIVPTGQNRRPEFKNATASALDNTNNLLYVISETNLQGMAAFRPAPCNNGSTPGPETCLDFIGSQIYSNAIVQSTKIGDFPGLGLDAMKLTQLKDITIDSLGNIYVLVKATTNHRFDRIYKFAAPTFAQDGSVIALGDLIGWMGRCTSGPNCNYIEERSIGFACTDETCTVAGNTYGDRPGQFDFASALAMDPNDILYVADSGNQRVQRFTPDGLFAGEAKSQSACDDCAGFVLGDFGSPGNIAVNSGNFYVLDIDEELVHIFETSVVHSIDDKSAWIEYQSQTNYVGQDSFTFRATDGFMSAEGDLLESAPARVDINVARNFRPPIGEDGYAATAEERAVALTLVGYDLDGTLDTLVYRITQPPQFGTLSGNPPNVSYTPGKDFAGEDSFRFTLGDGRFTSEPATFTLVVTPTNDIPIIQFPAATLQAGLGHATTLQANIFDPDADEVLTAVVKWGDGTVENAVAPLDGGMGKPTLTPLVDGEAQLLGYHTYAAGGNYTIEIEVTDAAGTKATAQLPVTVGPMADLQVLRTASPVAAANVNQVAYELTVTNPRSNGQGTAATNVQLTEVLTGPATYRAAIAQTGSCQVDGMGYSCNLGNLAPDQTIKVTVQIDLSSSATPGSILRLDATGQTDTADALPENNRDYFEVAVAAAGGDYYVDAVRDGADANPGDGTCATALGECTLRAAIMESNAAPGKQTVVLGTGVFVLESAATASLSEASSAAPGEGAGDLDIAGDLTLIGVGAQGTTLSANSIDRVLEIHSGIVELANLTLAGGDAGTGEGGGLLINGGDVRLSRVSIDGNRAVNGGGILLAGGQLRLVESSLIQNSATTAGGGLFNRGATATLENVTISGNSAGDGGGINATGGNAQLLYVTLTGNSATNAGGGINATGNSARIENSLLAGNSAPTGPDCAPDLVSGGHNLIGTLAGCALSGSTDGNVVSLNTGLDSLTVNGGQTYSHPLVQGSQALGRATCVRPTDQGGITRSGDACDVGAYEAGVFTSVLYMPAIRTP
jgi:hypothetical protein